METSFILGTLFASFVLFQMEFLIVIVLFSCASLFSDLTYGSLFLSIAAIVAFILFATHFRASSALAPDRAMKKVLLKMNKNRITRESGAQSSLPNIQENPALKWIQDNTYLLGYAFFWRLKKETLYLKRVAAFNFQPD